ncbi:MAG: class I SAM-dependent methyltransferase [Acidimicrobiales bacterium]|nr:class I SAM-dependent methyltransferase [Acidimicrobiales bacterium]MCB1016149.1 class I SAM-dependent methyltransferase [Acidimicrobiales bacterium]
MKRVAQESLRRRVQPYLEMLVRIEVAKAIEQSPDLAAKYLPTSPEQIDLIVGADEAAPQVADDGLPLPPPDVWELEGDRDGAPHFDAMVTALGSAGCTPASCRTVLDFGCGSARLLRCWHGHDDRVLRDLWGVDINATSVQWCRTHLSPHMRFATCTTLPTLPFEDRTFDLVYACSVFTHISELAESWLLELRRILRPGGFAYVTVQDQSYVKAKLAQPASWHWTSAFVHDHAEILGRLGHGLEIVSLGRASKDAMVFHDRGALLESWSRYLDVVGYAEHAYDCQSAVVLRRPV